MGWNVLSDIRFALRVYELKDKPLLNGNEDAVKNRDIVEKKMTPADPSTAQTLARECIAKNYKGC